MATPLIFSSKPNSGVLKIFVVWPVWTSPRIKRLWGEGMEFPEPRGLGHVKVYVHTRTYTRPCLKRGQRVANECSTGTCSNSVCFNGSVTAF